jgi:hypothetical protein
VTAVIVSSIIQTSTLYAYDSTSNSVYVSNESFCLAVNSTATTIKPGTGTVVSSSDTASMGGGGAASVDAHSWALSLATPVSGSTGGVPRHPRGGGAASVDAHSWARTAGGGVPRHPRGGGAASVGAHSWALSLSTLFLGKAGSAPATGRSRSVSSGSDGRVSSALSAPAAMEAPRSVSSGSDGRVSSALSAPAAMEAPRSVSSGSDRGVSCALTRVESPNTAERALGEGDQHSAASRVSSAADSDGGIDSARDRMDSPVDVTSDGRMGRRARPNSAVSSDSSAADSEGGIDGAYERMGSEMGGRASKLHNVRGLMLPVSVIVPRGSDETIDGAADGDYEPGVLRSISCFVAGGFTSAELASSDSTYRGSPSPTDMTSDSLPGSRKGLSRGFSLYSSRLRTVRSASCDGAIDDAIEERAVTSGVGSHSKLPPRSDLILTATNSVTEIGTR